VKATRWEIAEITRRPEDLARWWPSAFLESRTTNASEDWAAGQEFACRVKGWLPYTLRFEGRVEEAVYGERFTVAVRGDFEGRMECRIAEDGPDCVIQFDWRVWCNKWIVRRLSWVLKLLFYSNHIWVMTKGRQSIHRELAKLRVGGGCAVGRPLAYARGSVSGGDARERALTVGDARRGLPACTAVSGSEAKRAST
jgi:hypothetical protein